MRVSQESQVQDKESYLHKWDTTSRKYFNHFETHKVSAKVGLQRIFENIFTAFRDPLKFRGRFQDVDILVYRQLLGDISQKEVKEVNKVFQARTGFQFTKGYKEPAQLFAWRYLQIYALTLFGGALAGYAKFVKGYNILWFAGSFAPLATYLLYNWARQPNQELENCYKYLLAKRAATCEWESNSKKFH